MKGYPKLERIILASLVHNPEEQADILPTMVIGWFTDIATINLFQLLHDMHEKGELIDLNTVGEYLNRCGSRYSLNEEGLSEIMSTYQLDIDITDYVKRVEDYYNNQRILAIVKSTEPLVAQGIEPDAIANQLIVQLENIHGECDTQFEVGDEFRETIELAQGNAFLPIPFFLHTFDSMGIGLYRKEVNLVAARPRNGKSTFVIDRTKYWLRNGYAVMWFHCEMSKHQAISKLICNMADIDFSRWQSNALTDTDRVGLVKAEQEWNNWKGRFWIYDNIYYPPTMSKEIRKHKPDIVVLDYIQLISGSGKVSKKDNIDNAVRYLRRTLKDTNSAGLFCSQTNREVEKTLDGIPRLSHLAESDGLSQDSAIVAMLSWPYVNTQGDETRKNDFYIGLAKNRFGPMIGTDNIEFNPEMGQFMDKTDAHRDQLNLLDGIRDED